MIREALRVALREHDVDLIPRKPRGAIVGRSTIGEEADLVAIANDIARALNLHAGAAADPDGEANLHAPPTCTECGKPFTSTDESADGVCDRCFNQNADQLTDVDYDPDEDRSPDSSEPADRTGP